MKTGLLLDILICTMALCVFTPANLLFATCTEISDTPLETKVEAAPANVMFVLDNSGSMDWEFMTSENDGLMYSRYYLFPDSAFINGHDRVFGSSNYLGYSYSSRMRDWRARWSGYNKIFFNPNAVYDPWPLKSNADTSTPWSNPHNTSASDSKFDMEGTYYSVTAGSGGTVSVKNAHYFVINDTDGDDEKDSGEDVYLVNFVNGIRAYYLFSDADSDNRVDSGELYLKTGSDIPDEVKTVLYDEDGEFLSYATDAEDLQNFANWFSYFRKRELTSKAAVSTAIYNLDWVYVGFYSINSGLRQTVLPIGIETGEIIVDNQESGYTENGSWNESSAAIEYAGSSRYTSNKNAYATFTPSLSANGRYKVYVWYTKAGTRDTNALYTVNHQGGTYTKRINQQQNYGQWVELGEWNFSQGTSGYVRVKRDGSSTGSSTSADAVKFVEQTGASVTEDETDTLLDYLYDMDSSGGTPLRTALKSVGQYFHADDGKTGGLGASPYASADNGGACQQSFAIVMTDGFWNGSSPDVGNQDSNSSNNYDGSPYADTYSNTLADVAMKYYKNDLSSALDDEIPTNSCDPATHQHMVTYGVSLGVTGDLDPDDYHSCLLDGSQPSWPDPTDGDSEKIDDLYHASINGRGLFFSAGNPQELVDSLTDVMSNIASRTSSGASVSVNGEELNTGTVLYQASYNSDNWTGDVTAFPVDSSTGEIKKEEDDILWNAAERLQLLSAAERNIVTYNPLSESGIDFTYASLDSDQKAHMNPDSAKAEKVVRFIRGEEISGFRSRSKKLGDIVHSAPLLVGDTIYAGGNDGMLHAFDADTGDERFAYVPNLVMDNFYNNDSPEDSFYEPGYEHRFFVDLTPYAQYFVDLEGDGSDNAYTYLVGGLGKGGKGYYCLDITQADSKTHNSDINAIEEMIKWEYPKPTASTDEIDSLGYTFSTPFVVRTNIESSESTSKKKKYKWAVIFGNGYGSDNGSSELYILDLNGDLIKKINTGSTGCNGLSTPSIIDVDNDLRADYVYAGDLKGNLWKFDLTSSDPNEWAVAHMDAGNSPQPFFSIPGKPITSKPDVMRHCEYGTVNENLYCEPSKTVGYMVMFGTGKYLSEDDRTSTESQYVFGLWDYGDDSDDDEYLGSFDTGASQQLSNMDYRISLVEQTEEASSGYYNGVYLRILTANQANWTVTCDTDSGQNPDPDPQVSANAGWFFELTGGERVIKDVIIRNNNLIYITFIPDVSPCSGGGNSIIHEVDACTGGRLTKAQFDTNHDRKVDDGDLLEIEVTDPGSGQKVMMKVPATGYLATGLLHVPVFLQFPDKPVEMKIFSTSSASTITLYEVAEPRGLFYWRTH